MKLISMLAAILIVALILQKQFAQKSSSASVDINGEKVAIPKVPSSPKEVENFEKDINKFMKDAATERSKELENQLQQ